MVVTKHALQKTFQTLLETARRSNIDVTTEEVCTRGRLPLLSSVLCAGGFSAFPLVIYGDIICPIESLNDLRDSCNWIGPIYALLASLALSKD